MFTPGGVYDEEHSAWHKPISPILAVQVYMIAFNTATQLDGIYDTSHLFTIGLGEDIGELRICENEEK